MPRVRPADGAVTRATNAYPSEKNCRAYSGMLNYCEDTPTPPSPPVSPPARAPFAEPRLRPPVFDRCRAATTEQRPAAPRHTDAAPLIGRATAAVGGLSLSTPGPGPDGG